MSAIYFAIPTNAGQAKITNAIALGIPLKITHMAVGDGNGQPVTPNPAQTALVREQRRAPLNTLFQDPLNPAQLVAEQIIPETVGGWWIREVGLYDEAGTLIAIANSPDTYKPQLSEGSGRTQTIRMVLIVSDTSSVELKIDPSVVLATRKFVEDKLADEIAKLDNKQSVRVGTTGAIALSAEQTIDGVALSVGDRVLVKNQATASQNGIYVVSSGAWSRATDADISAEVTPGLVVSVEQGTLLADTIWKLTTNAPIVLNTTALTFVDITAGYATLSSPAFTGNPTAPTPPQFDTDTSVATTEFVQKALGSMSGTGHMETGTIGPAQIGKIIQPAEGAILTFPKPSTVGFPDGTSIKIAMYGRAAATLRAGAGSGFVTDLPITTDIPLVAGQCLTLTAFNDSWAVEGNLKTDKTFGASLASSGYQKLPSGLIVQWGSVPVAGNSTTTVTLPIAFPNSFPQCIATIRDNMSAYSSQPVVAALPLSNSQVSIRCYYTTNNNVSWFAIGY